MKSWKTTTSSLISSGASFVLFCQMLGFTEFPKIVTFFALFCSVGGMAAFGISAKDYNATGGTVPTTPEAQARIEQKP
jgi:hypothetical protein